MRQDLENQAKDTPVGANADVLLRARDLAEQTAYEAGALLRERVKTERLITHKGTVDLVTDADEESERLISGALHEVFPDFRLAGEEGATGAAESDYGWLIDPIDGTTNFAHGYPHFAISICLEFRGTPVVGVIYDPMRDLERERGAVIKKFDAFLSELGYD